MISVFSPEETLEKILASNGIKILKPLKAVITKVDNGDYYLDLRDDLDMLEFYQSGNILRCTTPWGKQCFRIRNVTVENRKINVRAWHVFYDSENYIIADSYVFQKNCNDALDHLNAATEADRLSPFKTNSDVPGVNNYRCVRKSLAEAVKDVLGRWGGHLVRNNWRIEIRTNIGQDRGVDLLYGKNIVNIKADEDWSAVATKVLPVGKDGLLLPELWIEYSRKLYDIPYTKVISFDQSNIDPEKYEDAEQKVDETAYKEALINDLRDKGNDYLEKNCIPRVSYTLNAYLKNVSDVGDTIWVEHEKFNDMKLFTKVFSLEFDLISQRITKVEFRNFTNVKTNNLSNLLNSFDSKIASEVAKGVGNGTANLRRQLTEATQSIRDTMNDSYVIYDGEKILIVDKLPKETAKNVIMINNGGIGFSQTGIYGTFNSAWAINGELNMQNINVINLVCDMLKGGTLKLGSSDNQSGIMELHDGANHLICRINKDGIRMFCENNSSVVLNAQQGLVGYDSADKPIYWVSQNEFHMRKSVVEDEITIAHGLRFLPITTDTNTGVGIVAMV